MNQQVPYRPLSNRSVVYLEKFEVITEQGFSGVVRRETDIKDLLKTIKEEGENIDLLTGRILGNFHVKPLAKDERVLRVPPRFSNAITVYSKLKPEGKVREYDLIPKPLALIGEGDSKDILLTQDRMFYVSEARTGSNLLSKIDSMNQSELQQVFRAMKGGLETFKLEGIYPLNLAPRDILITGLYPPIFCDTEEVLYSWNADSGYDPSDEEARKEQRRQFREDYKGIFKGNGTLERLVDYVLPVIK